MKNKIIASIKNVELSFYNPVTKKMTKVLRNTGFEIIEGEIHGIIGESGSGKSVITSLLNGIKGKGAKITSGVITLFGKDVTHWSEKDWIKSKYRGKDIGKVFQNPMSALNPALKIKYQLIEQMIKYKIFPTEKKCIEEAIILLERMGIQNPKNILNMYPWELSGGMIQRVVIAMVISLKPKIIIFDEPTTALDPFVQAGILKLIKNLNKDLKISMVFITHDIGVIANIANKISVMYAGRIIEYGSKKEVLFNSKHPYTWGLLCSLPSSAINGNLIGIKGVLDIDSIKDNQDAFAVRNNYAMDIDLEQRPPMFKINKNHFAATWLLHEKAPSIKPPRFIVELKKYR